MRRKLGAALAGLSLVASAAGTVYLAAALARVVIHGRRSRPVAGAPPVTVLKPLCGLEEGLLENLCSFCEQDFPAYQVIFGVRVPSDPAAAIAQRVIERFPERDLLLVTTGRGAAQNPKVANLAGMIGAAKHEVLVISDADMRVDRSYLRNVVAPFGDAGVGAVTCLYRGSTGGGTLSRLAAMFFTDQFAPSVLVAAALEPLRYCFGATMAVRRSVLERAGGLGALAEYVADDHRLGQLVTGLGLRVVLAPYVIENVLSESSLLGLCRRELRWARTIRAVRPAGYAFSFVTFGFPLAALAVFASPRDRLAWALLLVASGLRLALHFAARATFGVSAKPEPHLIPLRDALSFSIWAVAFAGRRVRWRERAFRLDGEGRLEPS